MIAVIRDVKKEILPRFNHLINCNEPTLMVVVTVDFVTDQSELHHTQVYAELPEIVNVSYFQKQADAMQADVDHAKQTEVRKRINDESHSVADKKVAQLLHARHIQLELNDSLPIRDKQEKSR